MHKKILIYLSLLVVIAVPCLLYAQTLPNPTVVSFKVTGYFVAGSNFIITLANVPDLTKLGPTVTLEGKPLTVTSAGKTTITGKLPEGVPKKGGNVKIKYQATEVPYTLYVPYIESIFLPKVEKGGSMNIGGGNFDENKCNATLPNSSISIISCSQSTIRTTIGNKFSGGNIAVTANGITSAPYPVTFQPPAIEFAENKDGIIPGSTLLIHAKGLSSLGNENLITLGSSLLEVISFNQKEGLIQVKLPTENAKGVIKLAVNGIESNTIAIDASFPPILTDFTYTEENSLLKVKAVGKFFSADASKVGLSIGTKSGSVKFANVNNIQAEFPQSGYRGCLSVTVYGLTSNCLAFNTVRPPILHNYMTPVYIPSENKYEWTIFAENVSDKKDKTLVYVNGAKAEIKEKFLNRFIVRVDQTPDVGEVYVVSDGVESNRLSYDFGQQFYPSISSVSSNGKFMYAQPVTIYGKNLGQEKFKNKVSINISGVGLSKTEDGKSIELKLSPSEITVRLDDKVKAGAKATIAVTVNGKKSNQLSFVTGQNNKDVFCAPAIFKINYPAGIMRGSKIRIEGQCFSQNVAQNTVYFDAIAVQPTVVSSDYLDVIIPKDAKAKGKIKVKTQAGESNQLDYISAESTDNAFTFAFENLGTKALSEIGKEGTIAKLQIYNTLGEIEMQTMKFKFVYEDDKNNPNSVLKIGSLPLSDIKVLFSGAKKQTIAPVIVERIGTNSYLLTLDAIHIIPSNTVQTLEFRTTIKPFAVNGAKIHMEFDPAKIDNFSGLLIRPDKQEVMKIKQKPITSETVTFSQTSATCIHTDAKKTNCSNLTKPKLPSIPKK